MAFLRGVEESSDTSWRVAFVCRSVTDIGDVVDPTSVGEQCFVVGST